MIRESELHDGPRRRFGAVGRLIAIAVAIAARGLAAAELAQPPGQQETVRDRLWLFACVAGSDNDYLERANFPRRSRMTPAEAAFYLDVPNLMMVRWQGQPEPPFDQYAVPFRPLRRVVWSLVDSGGQTSGEGRRAALEFAARSPNLTGFIMDDFFIRPKEGAANLSLEELKALRSELVIGGKRRDLYVVVYRHQLEPPIKPYLELCDKITYWTWEAKDLATLEEDFPRLEKLVPARPKLLGCYFWDYGGNRPTPLEMMKKQCRLALAWLRQGRIEGIVLLGNTVVDLDLPAVEWTRQWIAQVGREPIAPIDSPRAEPPAGPKTP